MNRFEIPEIIGKCLAKSKPYDQTIQEHTNMLYKEAKILLDYGYLHADSMDKQRMYYLLLIACKYHDYGKANPFFQERVKKKKKFNPEEEIAHNVLSLFFIDPDSDEFKDREEYYMVAYTVLYHHKYCDERDVISKRENEICSSIKEFETNTYFDKVGRRIRMKIYEIEERPDVILLKGYLHRCDYSASAGIPVEYPNDFLNDKLNSLLLSWKAKNSMAAWNEMQRFAIEHQNGNMIITAQTGMGKTEAGLLWIGNTKGFFILPIRTAINAMYKRIKNQILGENEIDTRLGLLHGETLEQYSDNVKSEIDIFEYKNKTRQLSLPLTISTLDQLFDFVFKYSGYEMKLTTLSYSKIVIDEIQMYSADLLAYLIYGCERIRKLGGKIAILTATLAPFIKDLLIEKVFGDDVVIGNFTDDNVTRHNIKVYDKELNAEDILEKYESNKSLGKSNKILVVCNTVRKAQELYDALKEEADDKELHIFHNKFIKEDKERLENEILKFGKTYIDDDNRIIMEADGIWISTSLVEASLDIDFDYLFTELSDLNSLFQRMGRCNRKGVKNCDEYNCFVYTKIYETTIQKRGRKFGFIDEDMFMLSKAALGDIDGKISESDKIKLLDNSFTTQNVRNSNFYNKFCDFYKDISELKVDVTDKNDACLRKIVSYTIIPKPVYNANKDIIDELLPKTKIKDNYEERWHALRELQKFTLSIEPYVFYMLTQNERPYLLSQREEIYVLDCVYDNSGFRAVKSMQKDEAVFW